ncbi:unnamed protein product [Lymnaea stagnalis]|uniref:Uncharacterized protein n=1 Tax=Lymnaea stagnalis TaxID=6523 RepID=A0AAV2H6T4_LYMST
MFPAGPTLWGGQGRGKNKKTEEWTNNFNSSVELINHSLSTLYNGIETDEDLTKDSDEQMEGDVTLQGACETLVHNCQKIGGMMREPTNGMVRLPLGKLLNVVARCLKVSHADVESVPSMTELKELLPVIYQSVLALLAQLIICCKTSLLPKSRFLIDLCLQTLSSTTQMKSSMKWQVRASALRVMTLLVQTLGWGKYWTSQSKLITKELITDIKIHKDPVKQVSLASTTSSDLNKQEAALGRRKKEKKKRNKAESYNDLAVENKETEDSKDDSSAPEAVSTLSALEFSRLALENLEFAFAENLMWVILDTAATLQREGPPVKSPYLRSACRKQLYLVVFACTTVRLDSGCGRKDTITQYQMVNAAMNFLNDAMQTDATAEVQKTCRQMLTILRLTCHLNRPIVRRILPDDSNEAKDVMEMERESLQLSEENEQLRKRLMDSEMENQQQNRLITSLRLEIDDLKKRSANSTNTTKDGEHSIGNCTLQVTETDQASDEDNSDPEETRKDERVNGLTVEMMRDPAGEPTVVDSSRAGEKNEGTDAEPKPKRAKLKAENSLSSPSPRKDEQTPKRRKNKKNLDESTGKKKRKTEELTVPKEDPESEAIQAMISDFVDAEPDIF